MTSHLYPQKEFGDPPQHIHPEIVETDLEESDNDCEEQERGRLSFFLDRLEKRIPRLYNITTVIIIPLHLLIILTIFCGHFLATLESQSELDSLNDSLASYLDVRGEIESIAGIVERTYDDCVEEFINTHTERSDNITELRNFLKVCKLNGMENAHELVHKWEKKMETDLIDGINLNWNRCFINNKNETSMFELREQNQHVGIKWFESFQSSFDKYLKTHSNEDAHSAAVAYARDNIEKSCEVNSAGGAIFWFTIMTTIGYGNTAPQTNGGKAMVYTLGFLSILLFAALSNGAGYVSLTIADDFFESVRLERLTKGWLSVLFWFLVLWLWIIVLAAIFFVYDQYKYDRIEPLPKLIWWAFISVTTVGFGDIYIAHDTILMSDMFYVPLLMLLGFVFLANFLLKLSETIVDKVQRTGLTDDESLNFLLKQSRKSGMIIDIEKKKDVISPGLAVESGLGSDNSPRIKEENIVANKETDEERKEINDREGMKGGPIVFTSRYERIWRHSITTSTESDSIVSIPI